MRGFLKYADIPFGALGLEVKKNDFDHYVRGRF